MKKIITLLNKKNGAGKTTIALNLASVMAHEYGLKVGVLEIAEHIYDTKIILNPKNDHAIKSFVDITNYKLDKEKFYLFWDTGWKNTIEHFYSFLDVLLIDTEGFPAQTLLDMSDTILIPAALNPYDMKYASHTAMTLLEMRYPAAVVNVLINKANNTLLSVADLQQGFNNIKVIEVIPYCKAVEETANNGEIYCLKNRKDAFTKVVKNTAAILLEGASKQHLYIMELQTISPKQSKIQSKDNILTVKYEVEAGLKKTINKLLFDEINIKNLEKDALTHPDKKIKIFCEIKNKIREILDRLNPSMIDRNTREIFVTEIFDEVTGLGAIEELLKDPSISEIMVNGHNEIYIEKAGKLFVSEKRFTDDENVMRTIERMVLPLGRRIDESMPYVDARLSDGSRVNAIIPPLSLDGPILTIRKFSEKKLTAEDLVNYGSISQEAVEYLREAVLKRKNILISGGTGSGKTTLLNVLSSFIPKDERIITVEDSAEL